jgi:hypothetical protein
MMLCARADVSRLLTTGQRHLFHYTEFSIKPYRYVTVECVNVSLHVLTVVA